MRLHEATTGEALFDGRDILAMTPKEFMHYKRRIQIIFQNPYASLNPRFIVGQILTEPMQIHGIGADAQERTELALRVARTRSGCPKSRSTSIRTNSPAGSASASRSPAASRSSPTS